MAATVRVTCANKQCGCTFTARVADRKRGWAKFCSKSCKAVVQTKSRVRSGRSIDHDQLGVGEIAGQWD